MMVGGRRAWMREEDENKGLASVKTERRGRKGTQIPIRVLEQINGLIRKEGEEVTGSKQRLKENTAEGEVRRRGVKRWIKERRENVREGGSRWRGEEGWAL